MWLRCVPVLLSLVKLAQLQTISQGDCTGCMEKIETLEKRIDEQRKEMDALEGEVYYWQNTTLSILRKCTLEEPGVCDGRGLKEDIQLLHQQVAQLNNTSRREGRELKELLHEEIQELKNTTTSNTHCASKVEEVEELLEQHDSEEDESHEEIMDAIASVNHIQSGTFRSPAASCKQLKAAHPASPSRKYWIQNPESGYASQQYCDMTRTDCGGARGWMRIAYLDMDNPSHHCPSGFREITSPVRACGRPSGPGCVSVTFSTFGTKYRRVTGKVIGYQDKTPEAFIAYYNNRGRTLDGVYVDGVSITHGQPRKHIWTFAAAQDETRSERSTCPCTISGATYTGVIPPFVGNDYFCETGSRYKYQFIFYDEDPLWDKSGCGDGSTCCSGSSFFCKQLPHATDDHIELRICSDQRISNEDTPLKHIELYVQ